jgi:RNA polymerase sigma-70 factor (ECF subfamily)
MEASMRFSSSNIEELYRRHSRMLNGLAQRHVGMEDAEDIVQEAYLRLLELQNATHVEDVRGYLFKIAWNVAIDCLRKRKSRVAYLTDSSDLDQIGGGEISADDAALIYRIQTGLLQLPRGVYHTFVLSRFYGLSYPEIAERLGVSLRTVNRRVSQAVDYLELQAGQLVAESVRYERRVRPNANRDGENAIDAGEAVIHARIRPE